MQTLNANNGSRTPAAIALRGAANMPQRPREAISATRRDFDRGEEIFAEGEPCSTFYKVVSGTVRTSKLLTDGRRQIDAFHFPGDVFGLESGECHRFTAEAVDKVVVIAYRRSSFGGLVQTDPAFGEQLMCAMLSSLDRAHDHMVLLGRKTALEKMASFILEIADRRANADRAELSMQRTDIADHLGLTIETVSRTLTQMVRAGLIRLTEAGRTVILANKAGLELLRL
ncbi:MAG TPA: cyclic nucleotide-binding domain-containing protein [Reyranella sp.]|nr:cyclic nucleotide-binding domain-containing protein [Reyranella sp.]